ncbi:hypothetical protein LNKW23_35390 [Paralimibaculum aggregatum]|uniref:Uncharacterized protein n=1 Tax=Paralimibaculum aggregatum TaxID=3036245 RepID=A0ABQ6LPG6_9RHOB|nr:hypothetical protein [Limibaculum sp. NKW23]GMG84324.1 hypothetical protein LNKW23_35390 [Limibaculum sp. NKW23]
MKANAKPELEQKWWRKNKAKTLKSTGFGKVLGEYETALKDFETWPANGAEKAYETAVALLSKRLPSAADAAIKACNARLHKDTVACLETYRKKTFPEELKRIQAIRKNFDELASKAEREVRGHFDTIGRLFDEAADLQEEIYTAIGGIEDAKKAAIAASKKADKPALEAAGKIATAAMQKASAAYGKLGKLQKPAETAYRNLQAAMARAADPGAVDRLRKDAELGKDKIVNVIQDMDYEMKDAMKAENQLLGIIEGRIDETAALAETIERSCRLFMEANKGVKGNLNQISAELSSLRDAIRSAGTPSDGGKQATAFARSLKTLVERFAKSAKSAAAQHKKLTAERKTWPKDLLSQSSFARLKRDVEIALGQDDATVKDVRTITTKLKETQQMIVGLNG